MDNTRNLNNCLLVAGTSLVLGLGALGYYDVSHRVVKSSDATDLTRSNLEAVLVEESKIRKYAAKKTMPNDYDSRRNYRK